MWFTKRRRAQNDQDYETWIEGGVSPTLNAFDNAHESRATVVIVFAPGPMVRLGGNIWENGVVPTLRAEAKRGDAEPHILVIDGTRVDDVRVYDDGLTPCLKNRMGTGGNNVPFIATDVEGKEVAATLRGFGHGWQGQHNSTHAVVTEEAEPVIAFDGYNQSVTEDVYRALRIGIDSGDCIAIPIQDGREMEKKQNGMGVGDEGDPSYTLDQTGAQAVAYSIREDAKANNFSATEIQTARALQALQPSVQSHHAQTFITEPTMQVRRLTPTECERLMGWPDNHTATGTNGPVSDTNRYKMCGNGVASPVAQWIGEHLMRITEGRPDSK